MPFEVHTAFYVNLAENLSYSTSWKGIEGLFLDIERIPHWPGEFLLSLHSGSLQRSFHFTSSVSDSILSTNKASSSPSLPFLCFSMMRKKSQNISLYVKCGWGKKIKMRRREELRRSCSENVFDVNGRTLVGDFFPLNFFSLVKMLKVQEKRPRMIFYKLRLLRVSKEISPLCCHACLIHLCFHWSSLTWNQQPHFMASQMRDFFVWRLIVITNNKLETQLNFYTLKLYWTWENVFVSSMLPQHVWLDGTFPSLPYVSWF